VIGQRGRPADLDVADVRHSTSSRMAVILGRALHATGT
jgi:hypothetical protein